MDTDYMKNTDFLGKDALILKKKKLFLFDMDGTIYNEDKLFDGTLELLNEIHNIGGKYIFITNNSSKSVKDYILKVKRLGIKADKDNFFTSTQATIFFLKENFPNKKLYCQGTESLIKELIEAGLEVETGYSEDAEIILVGFDTELTSLKIWNTCKMLQKDIPYIATNPDFACPVSFGFIPDCGSICLMYEQATGKKPLYIGKPEPTMVNIVRNKFKYSTEETVVIGDRLYTDIASGINANVTTICVLTGEATIKDIREGNIKPTFTFQSIKELLEIIRN